jgi:hypothetical protein
VFETGPENDRFRDVMDVLLVEHLIHAVGLAQVRAACVDIFTVRNKHAWPPTATVYESWRIPFTALARENGFTPEDVDEAAAALTALIAAIDAAVDQGATSPGADAGSSDARSSMSGRGPRRNTPAGIDRSRTARGGRDQPRPRRPRPI